MGNLATHAWYISTIIAVSLAFYLRILNYDFISDDRAIAARTPKGGYPDPKNAWQRWWMQFRCKRYFKPREVHTLNIFFHTTNSILIYFLFGANLISFAIAMLFLVNPVNSQCAIWGSGRSYSASTTLVLLMFIFPWCAPLFYFLTKFFSANAILAPLAFITTEYWFWAFLPLGLLFVIRKVLHEKSTTSVSTEMRAIGLRKIVTFVKTFGYYTLLCLFPFRLGWHHEFIWGIGVTEKYNKQCYAINWEFWRGLFILYVIATNFWLNWSNEMWGLLWFTINIAMWCNFMTWQQQIAERFCYLANVGMMAMLVKSVWILYYPVNLIVIGMFFAGYAVKLWLVTPMYKNEYWRVEHTAIDKPKSHYIWLYRGFKKFNMQNYVGALYDFLEARVHSPHEFKTNFNLCSTYLILQNLPEARKYLAVAKENMYVGEEDRLKPHIKAMEELLDEAEKTKVINVQKIILFS